MNTSVERACWHSHEAFEGIEQSEVDSIRVLVHHRGCISSEKRCRDNRKHMPVELPCEVGKLVNAQSIMQRSPMVRLGKWWKLTVFQVEKSECLG